MMCCPETGQDYLRQPMPSHNPHNHPSHLSEGMFRLYEPHLNRAVTRFTDTPGSPQETEFGREVMRDKEGRQLSGNTWVARFRDAIVSLKRFQWRTDVDVEKLWRITGEYVLSLDPTTGSVWFRHKQRKGRPADYIEEARNRGLVRSQKVHKTWTVTEVDAVCALLHMKWVDGPFVLEGKVGVDVVLQQETSRDVAFTYDEDKNQTIIT